MSIFKIIFIKNEILSCKEIPSGAFFDGSTYCELDKGQLRFAIIKAESTADATGRAQELVEQLCIVVNT
jgi:hypothetical protein